MKRYNKKHYYVHDKIMEEDDKGEWVKCEDAQKEIEEKNKEIWEDIIKLTKEEIEDWQSDPNKCDYNNGAISGLQRLLQLMEGD